MDFPSYVPAAARQHLSHYLEGEPDRAIPGYLDLASRALDDLSRIDRAIEGRIQRGEEEYLPSLRSQRREAAEHHARMARDLQMLQRLALDARMRDAYSALIEESLPDQSIRSFLHSAWAAGINFSAIRERHQRAKELALEIAEEASALRTLLLRFASLGLTGPDEFCSIPTLLRQTDNHDMEDHNLHMWRAMRSHLLGDRVAADGCPEEAKRQDTARYAWGTAPDVADLLATLKAAAASYEPDRSGFIGAALDSRKGTVKTAYIRAFANLLRDRDVPLNARVKRAMALTSNVILNDPDDVVSAADVRAALKRAPGV